VDTIGVGQPGYEVTPLGDVDGDGLADVAVPNDRFGLAVVYGARQWPRRIDLRVPGARVGIVRGSAAGRLSDAVARQGSQLVGAAVCVSCPRIRTVRVAIPRARTVVSLEGPDVSAPTVTAPVRLAGQYGPWASGREPVMAWLTTRPARAMHFTPVVGAPGRPGKLLGPGDALAGLDADAALVVTHPDVAPNANLRTRLKLYRLSGNGKPRTLSPPRDNTSGAMMAIGRCLVVSGWGDAPAAVWAIDRRSLDTVGSWAPQGAAAVAGSPTGASITIVAVSPNGRLSRGGVALPSKCR
jgi:hypothetical protein